MKKIFTLVHALVYLFFITGSTNALSIPEEPEEKSEQESPVPLIKKIEQVTNDVFCQNGTLALIKKLTNEALSINTKDAGSADTPVIEDQNCYELSLSLQDEECDWEGAPKQQEAPKLKETQKLLSENLEGHMLCLVQDFFKTAEYAKVKQNIDIYNQFVLSCPAWKQYENDDALQNALDFCCPENCFKQKKGIVTGYYSVNDKTIGAYWWFQGEQKIFENVSIAVTCCYLYSFERTEKRTMGIKDYALGQYLLVFDDKQKLVPAANILTQDVCIAPGHFFKENITFVFNDKNDDQMINKTTYEVSLFDAEKCFLKDTLFLKASLPTGEKMVEVDPATAENPAFIKNRILYEHKWIDLPNGDGSVAA